MGGLVQICWKNVPKSTKAAGWGCRLACMREIKEPMCVLSLSELEQSELARRRVEQSQKPNYVGHFKKFGKNLGVRQNHSKT